MRGGDSRVGAVGGCGCSPGGKGILDDGLELRILSMDHILKEPRTTKEANGNMIVAPFLYST